MASVIDYVPLPEPAMQDPTRHNQDPSLAGSRSQQRAEPEHDISPSSSPSTTPLAQPQAGASYIPASTSNSRAPSLYSTAASARPLDTHSITSQTPLNPQPSYAPSLAPSDSLSARPSHEHDDLSSPSSTSRRNTEPFARPKWGPTSTPYFATEEAYLTALRAWADDQKYITLGDDRTRLEGFYGNKTMGDYIERGKPLKTARRKKESCDEGNGREDGEGSGRRRSSIGDFLRWVRTGEK